MANIRSVSGFVNSWWDWSAYNECFGRRIRISDVDGMVERNGKFLLIETKRPYVPVPEGQRILFDHLIQDKRFSVVVVWGETNEPHHWMLWRQQKIQHGGIEEFKAFLKRWYAWADGEKPLSGGKGNA